MSSDTTPTVITAQTVSPIRHDILSLRPALMVKEASELATVLADVINKQELYILIKGKKYVKHEGWATLGCMLGILPREKSVIEHRDGSFEAVVELYSLAKHEVVGQGSALCGKDENQWKNSDRYARRSMAITRATGKAFRLGFSWVMALAGYAATPAEEMPHDVIEHSDSSLQGPVWDFDGSNKEHIESIEKRMKVASIDPKFLLDIIERLDGKAITANELHELLNSFIGK